MKQYVTYHNNMERKKTVTKEFHARLAYQPILVLTFGHSSAQVERRKVSASEVTTIWRYTNVYIIIIIIKTKN